MTVFITGGSGLVGAALLRRFLAEGFKIKALLRITTDTHLISDLLDKIEVVEGDILDIFSYDAALNDVDFVVHAAAMVSFAPKDAQKMYKSNVEGTANLVNICLEKSIKKFCFISSIATFGRPSTTSALEVLIDENQKWEDSELNSNYAKSKYLAECEVWRAAAEGLKMVILNPTIIFGEGDWQKSSTQMFKYVYTQKPFYTAGYINYVDVKDVTEIAYQLTISEVCNEKFAVTAGNIAVKELFEKIAKGFKVSPPKYKIGKKLIEVLWRLEALKSFFTKNAPLITKETAKTSQLRLVYANNKIVNQLNYKFIAVDKTIARVCEFLEKNKG